MNMKKIIKLGVSALLLAGLVLPSNNAFAQEDKVENIEVIAKGFTQQYWTSVQNGANKAAEELGVTINFVGPANETAIQEQAQMLSNAINKQPDAIALASLDTNSQIDMLNQATDAGIPIVGFDSGVPDAPEGTIQATAATDNMAASEIAAEKIFEATQEKIQAATVENPVRLGILSQEVNSSSISDRTEGFINKINELVNELDNVGEGQVAIVGHDKFANGVSENDAVVIIQVSVPASATDTDVQNTAQAMLNLNDIVSVYSTNETASKGLINANESVGGVLGEDGIIAAGFDSGMLQKEAIRNGAFIGSVTQDPITIGYEAVKLAYQAGLGEDVSDLDIKAAWYNAENIDSDEIAPLLYD